MIFISAPLWLAPIIVKSFIIVKEKLVLNYYITIFIIFTFKLSRAKFACLPPYSKEYGWPPYFIKKWGPPVFYAEHRRPSLKHIL